VARGENIVTDLSTVMGPPFYLNGGGERKGERYIFFLFTVGPPAVSTPSPRALPACRAVGAHHFVPLTPVSDVIAGHQQRGKPGEIVVRATPPPSPRTSTVPRGAPSRRCGPAASPQTISSAERRPAHPGELVRLAHRYRHIVGRPPSPRPPGKRCRLVSLIFCLFFSSGGC